MRLHRNLVDAVVDGFMQINNDGLYADKVIERLLKRDKRWGSKDRAFIAETLYELVRYKRLYTEIAQEKAPFTVQSSRRVFAVWAVLRGITLPEWYFEGTPERRIKGRFDELSRVRALRESVPDWLDALGVAELGEEAWGEELHALNQQAAVVLRVNTLKIDREALRAQLAKEGYETEPLEGYPDALQLKKRANVFLSEAFKQGLFELQDASSQRVAPLLLGAWNPSQGSLKVADCCAGAGGKTLHLAALMGGKGKIVAMDIYPQKLDELSRRAKRNGAYNIETRLIETKYLKRQRGTFDRVLIDAPCSGLGVLRRNPDTKWKLTPEFLEEIRQTQAQLLAQYSLLVKEGGSLVYATCSILPSENEQQVQHFLASEAGKRFTLVEQHKISTTQGYDGFYMAALRVKSEE
ncbi:class I SAM-dependent methyltransferase [Capnocytophaga gingivalis]|uniref:RsmB/NOP family class I SAM-dependent RNA methyltransferase n=1 Tax=Capnocytophaga gingivalis TaxID=1017 RepID=UPI0028EB7A72|nr:class I SAM-dependent methyltransferase [Capnocytophaga gingivalis]